MGVRNGFLVPRPIQTELGIVGGGDRGRNYRTPLRANTLDAATHPASVQGTVMTKEQAQALLDRNPRVKEVLIGLDVSKLDIISLPGKVSVAEDAGVNWVSVANALALCRGQS